MQSGIPVGGVFLAVLLGLLAASPIVAAAPYGEDPAIEWQQLLGGNQADYGSSVQQTADGGYVLIGHSDSSLSGDVASTNHGGFDYWVVKLNAAGVVQWQKLLGGNWSEYASFVQQTADGGYILLGLSYSSASGNLAAISHGIPDCWVVKLDGAGAIQWEKLLGGSGEDHGQSIQQTADGGYILVGFTSSSASGDVTDTNHGVRDYWVVKLDGSGAVRWQKLLGGTGDDCAFSVKQTTDGGYVIAGQSTSSMNGDVADTNHGNNDYWVVKLNAAGVVQWQNLLGGSGHDYGYSVQQTSDGGYVLLGQSGSSASGDVTGLNNGGYDYWVVKLDGSGAVQWQKLLGGSDTDNGQSIQQTTDGGYVVLGMSGSGLSGDVTGANHGTWDYWTVKLDRTGAIQWQKLLGGSGHDQSLSVYQASDGGYILLGYSTSSGSGDVADTSNGSWDCWVVKMTAVPGLHLSPGWNLVSVPAVLAAGYDTASIFSGVNTDGHSIFLYNAATLAWTPMTASTKVKPLDGIWIYAKTATTVPLTFETNPQAVPPAKSLAAGWNAVGYSSVKAATARDALSSVAAKWSTLKGFDAATQRYETSIVNGGTGDYSDSREMLPGKGYWLSMREAGQLTGM